MQRKRLEKDIILLSSSYDILGSLRMTDKVKEEIIAIRDTGLTNMFDINAVQRIAFEMNYSELVDYLENNSREYVHFILKGDGLS